jgi:chromosome partitioning protein
LLTNLAGVMMRLRQRNLIIDLDAQGNVSDAFGLRPSKYTALNMFHEKVQTHQMITRYDDHLHVIQATEDMATLELDTLLSLSRFDETFNFLKPHVDNLRPEYDYILIDSPPQISLFVGNALAASDFVIIPFVPETFAIKGLRRAIKAVKLFQRENVNVKILAVVPMFVKAQTNLHAEMLEQARRYCLENDIYMTETAIPQSILFAKATAYQRMPATLGRDRSHETVKKYQELWAELSVQIKMHHEEVML